MSNQGGGGDPARNNGPGRGCGGGFTNAGCGGGFNGTSNSASFDGPPTGNVGRGGGGYNNNRFYGGGNQRQSNYVASESSGSAEDRDVHGQAFSTEFGADFGHLNRGSNFNSYNHGGGNFQYRPRNFGSNNYNGNNRNYNGGRSNYNQFRNSGGGNNGPAHHLDSNLADISPDLLKEAMQGVLTALAAAAQKGGESLSHVVHVERANTAFQTTPHGASVVHQQQAASSGPQQELPMQVDVTAAPKPDVPNPAKKAKKVEKNPCFRCKKPGHEIDTCTAPVCDICESHNHISSPCHLLHAPKPSVTMYGYAIEQLMFFELPTGGANKPKVDNVKLVKVTVEGDPMTIPEISDCLKRIVLVENFQWEIYNFQNNVFRVKFPNKMEAQRMKTFRTYPVPDRASDLVFEDWSALEDPLYMLPKVWLREGIDDMGGNNGGDDDNGSNGDNGEDTNDTDIEKSVINENPKNGTKKMAM
ncbi:hypothetical protein ACQ4PT_067668 [Festuca glaucescens]